MHTFEELGLKVGKSKPKGFDTVDWLRFGDLKPLNLLWLSSFLARDGKCRAWEPVPNGFAIRTMEP